MEAAGDEQCRQPTWAAGPPAGTQCRTGEDRTTSLPQAAQVAGRGPMGGAGGRPSSVSDTRGWMAHAVLPERQGLPGWRWAPAR